MRIDKLECPQNDKLSFDDTSSPLEKNWSVAQAVDGHPYSIAAGHTKSMKSQDIQ